MHGRRPTPDWCRRSGRVAQAKAQKDSADKHVAQNRANLIRVTDVLQKTSYNAPYDGVVTNLPVREGETVVMGIQNAPGSTLMTIADMSIITAEVKVDETDIVNVHLGQPAEVTIDAIPKKIFHGTSLRLETTRSFDPAAYRPRNRPRRAKRPRISRWW